MVVTIAFTLLVLLTSLFDDTLLNQEILLVSKIDFKAVLLDVMLSFLLFAGALCAWHSVILGMVLICYL